MPLILAPNGDISTAPSDTGSYSWADVVAIASSKLTTYANGGYRWTGAIDIQGGTLAIEDAEINLHGIDGTQPGIIRALANGTVRFGRKSTINGKTFYTNGCSIRITNEVSLAATEEAPLSYCFDNSSETIARLEIFASRVVLDSDFRSNIFVSESVASLLSKTNRGTFYVYVQPNGNLSDCTADRTNLELLGDSAFGGNRSYAAPFGLTLYTNSSRRQVVRDFAPAGATRDYQLDWLDVFTFLNCPDVALSNGRVGANNRTIAADSYKAFEHVLRIVDSAGNPIEGAQISYSGFQSLVRVSDADGLHMPFALIVERTDLIGQVGLRNGFLDTIDTSTYSREIKSYLHLSVAESIAISSELGSTAQPFPIALLADSGITQANPATAAAYSEFTNTATQITVTANSDLSRLYDNRSAYWRNTAGQIKPTRSGSTLNLGSLNLVIDGATLAATAKFDRIVTSGTVTLANDGSTGAIVTDSNGTRVAVAAPNLIAGTRIQLYNLTDSIELDNRILAGSGYSFSLQHTTDKLLRLKAIYVNGATAKEYIEATANLTSAGASFLQSQADNTFYNQIAIDGSTVAEFVPNETQVEINAASTPTSTLQRAYAKYIATLATEAGIRIYSNNVLPQSDIFNYLVDGSLTFRNTSNTATLTLTGGVIRRADGQSIVAVNSGSIVITPDRVYSIAASGGGSGGLTTTQENTLNRIDGNTSARPLIRS